MIELQQQNILIQPLGTFLSSDHISISSLDFG